MSLKKDYIKISKFSAMHVIVAIIALEMVAQLYGTPGAELLLDPLRAFHVAYGPFLMYPDTSALIPFVPWVFVTMPITHIALALLGFVSITCLYLTLIIMQYVLVALAPVLDLLTPNRYEGGRGP